MIWERSLFGRAGLVALLVLAAFLRFVGLADRGAWDSDQGRDLLVLRSLVVDGALPLVGPVTSVGGLHHGAAYYYLLAPVAALTALNPPSIAWVFAVAGVALVALVWWLARSIGGPVAGFTAGLLVALSPAAISSSVTIWNPNLVAPAAALTLAGAWQAWASRQARWWALSIGALGLAVQLHVLALILAPAVLALLVLDVRRSGPGGVRGIASGVLGGLGIVLVLFVPFVVHELGAGFGEIRSALAFVGGGGGGGGAADPISRLLVSVLRMTSWPIVGLVVDAPFAAIAATFLVLAVCAWRWLASAGDERIGTRWLVGTLAWSALALAFAAPDLAKVVRGLPNDQYHAFTDPIVPVLLGLGAAALTAKGLAGSAAVGRAGGRTRAPVASGAPLPIGGRYAGPPATVRSYVGPVAAAILVAGIVVVEALRFPPLRDPGGGWAPALLAAQRVAGTTGDRPILIVGLPRFKPADGFAFPLLQLGRTVIDETGAPGAAADTATIGGPLRSEQPGPSAAEALVVICDRLFEPTLGAACGGAAERVVEAEQPAFGRLVDRFDQSGRISVSVYLR